MASTEDGIVDFFTNAVERRHITVGILGATVALDEPPSPVTLFIELPEKVFIDDIVSVKDDAEVVGTGGLLHSILQRLSLTALLESRDEQRNGQRAKSGIGVGLLMVADNHHMTIVIRIVLADRASCGVENDAVFLVGGTDDKETMGSRQVCLCGISPILHQARCGEECHVEH